MEIGNGYQAIYGQLTDLTVSEGDTLKKGTTIGYIAQPTKYYSTEGTNLYFEMKKMENQLIRLRIFHNINPNQVSPCGGCEEQEAVGGDLLVSGG